MTKKPLRVGFDLDGVLLYNPARIARMPISLIKKLLLKKGRRQTFHIPSGKIEQAIWWLFHYTSLFTAPGLTRIKKLVREGRIEAYIVSARYGFLERDFDRWIKKINSDQAFTQTFMNHNNEQPHLFKERIIKELKLDIFIDDNWDIVYHLNQSTQAEILWIRNIFDRFITYKDKFSTLGKVVIWLEKKVNT